MKRVDTLAEDIHGLFKTGVELNDQLLDEFGGAIKALLKRRLSPDEMKKVGTLRMSNIGTDCDRKLWYSVNSPELAEDLDPRTRFKFLYGDLIEELILLLAKAAGHSVEGTQTTLNFDGVVGHRDAVIDGVVVDVKSASSRGFHKFQDHKLETDDPFGYLHQLGMYLQASQDDPLVTVKGEACFLAVDKEMGKIVVDKYRKPDVDYKELIARKRKMLELFEPPRRKYLPEPDGKSGNYKLPLQCSYCSFKHECWKDSNQGAGLRTFLYSTGPRFLVKVGREPDVPEAKGPSE